MILMRYYLLSGTLFLLSFVFFVQPIQAASEDNIPKVDENPEKKPDIAFQQSDVSDNIAFPSIVEINKSAKAAGLKNWSKLIKLKKKNYAAMSNPARIFEVGVTLADIAFTVFDDDQVPSKSTQELAFSALSSIELPDEFQAEFQSMKQELDSLSGEKIRRSMDQLINKFLSLTEKGNDNKETRDLGMTLLAAGYYKSYYLAAKMVSEIDSPTEEQLALFTWKDLTNDFINFFKKEVSEEYKKDDHIASFVKSLERIKPITEKSKEEVTKQDIQKIVSELGYIFQI